MNLVKPGETRGLTATGPDFAHQESAGCGFGGVSNWTESFLQSKPTLLVGYLDPLLILAITSKIPLSLYHIVKTGTLLIIPQHLINVVHLVERSICHFYVADILPFRIICGDIVVQFHSLKWLQYTAHKIDLWISEMYDVLFNGIVALLAIDSLQPSFKCNHLDRESHPELYLLLWSNYIYLSLQLIHSVVEITSTPCGGFSPSNGWMDLNSHLLVRGQVCHPLKIFVWSHLHFG